MLQGQQLIVSIAYYTVWKKKLHLMFNCCNTIKDKICDRILHYK